MARIQSDVAHQHFLVAKVFAGVVRELLEENLHAAFGHFVAGQRQVAELVGDVDQAAMLRIDRVDTGEKSLIPGKGMRTHGHS